MKEIIYTFLFTIFCFPFGLSAQITLTVDDVPNVGDELIYVTDTTVQGIIPGPPGINQSWDFTQLTPQDTFSYRVVAASEGPNADLFPEANIALEIDSIYLYAVLSDTALLNLGTALDILGTGMPFLVRFEPYQKLFQFPSSAGTNFEQTYSFQIDADGSFLGFDSVRFSRHTFERTSADASGTLQTPAATYQTLRLRTVSDNTDSIFVQQFGIWFPVSETESTAEQYNWIVEGGPGVVMTMFVDSLGRAESIDWLDTYNPGGEVMAPVAQFGVEDQGNGVFAFTDQSTNSPDSWQWDFGDGNTSTEQNPTHAYLQSGTYDVCLTASNSAGSDAACQMVNAVVTSVDVLKKEYGFRLFPNPARDQIHVRLAYQGADAPIIVFRNLAGQTLYRGQLENLLRLDTNTWPAGAYFFSVYTREGTLLGSGKMHINH
jgi:hypothetical protein